MGRHAYYEHKSITIMYTITNINKLFLLMYCRISSIKQVSTLVSWLTLACTPGSIFSPKPFTSSLCCQGHVTDCLPQTSPKNAQFRQQASSRSSHEPRAQISIGLGCVLQPRCAASPTIRLLQLCLPKEL